MTSRKAGSVELFNHLILFAVKGKNLDLLTEVQVVSPFREWRKNLKKKGKKYTYEKKPSKRGDSYIPIEVKTRDKGFGGSDAGSSCFWNTRKSG